MEEGINISGTVISRGKVEKWLYVKQDPHYSVVWLLSVANSLARVETFRRLREFWDRHTQAETVLRAWYMRVQNAQWQNFAEVRADFPSADQVQRLTVFNIGGNNYRLIARIEYAQQKVYIRAVLTHAEYDREGWKDDPWYN